MASASPWVMWSLAAMFMLVYNRLLQILNAFKSASLLPRLVTFYREGYTLVLPQTNYLDCMLMMGKTMAHIWHSHSSWTCMDGVWALCWPNWGKSSQCTTLCTMKVSCLSRKGTMLFKCVGLYSCFCFFVYLRSHEELLPFLALNLCVTVLAELIYLYKGNSMDTVWRHKICLISWKDKITNLYATHRKRISEARYNSKQDHCGKVISLLVNDDDNYSNLLMVLRSLVS